MKKISILWISLIILLVFMLIFVGLNVSKRTQPYKTLEDKIVDAMKKYYGDMSNLKKLPKEGRIEKISINELQKFGLEISLTVNGESCIGYGLVKGNTLGSSYKAFIKCENYTTHDYEKYEKY